MTFSADPAICKRDFETKWHRGTNINVLRISSEPSHADTEVVRIEGNVRES